MKIAPRASACSPRDSLRSRAVMEASTGNCARCHAMRSLPERSVSASKWPRWSTAVPDGLFGALAHSGPPQLGHRLPDCFLNWAEDGLPDEFRILLEELSQPRPASRPLPVGDSPPPFWFSTPRNIGRSWAFPASIALMQTIDPDIADGLVEDCCRPNERTVPRPPTNAPSSSVCCLGGALRRDDARTPASWAMQTPCHEAWIGKATGGRRAGGSTRATWRPLSAGAGTQRNRFSSVHVATAFRPARRWCRRGPRKPARIFSRSCPRIPSSSHRHVFVLVVLARRDFAGGVIPPHRFRKNGPGSMDGDPEPRFRIGAGPDSCN